MDDNRRINHSTAVSVQFEASAKRTLTIDVGKYVEFLAESGMSEEAKRVFLEMMWNIVIAFVDLGYGVHPLQEACGQPDERVDYATETDSNEAGPKEEHPHARRPEGSHRRGPEVE